MDINAAFGINNRGEMVVESNPTVAEIFPVYVYPGGTYSVIQVPNSSRADMNGLNNLGVAVGDSYEPDTGVVRALISTGGGTGPLATFVAPEARRRRWPGASTISIRLLVITIWDSGAGGRVMDLSATVMVSLKRWIIQGRASPGRRGLIMWADCRQVRRSGGRRACVYCCTGCDSAAATCASRMKHIAEGKYGDREFGTISTAFSRLNRP